MAKQPTTKSDIIRSNKYDQWWWRHENNVWSYDESNHNTTASRIWNNVLEKQGPVRISPFVDSGEEQFRTILVIDKWKGPVETSAHAYELIRRANRDHWMTTYLELNLEEQQFLKRVFGNSQRLPLWRSREMNDPAPSGFTIAACWNLTAYRDEDLVAGFKNWLNTQRTVTSIPEPRSSQPTDNTSPSWRLPELLDINEASPELLSKRETRTLAHALQLAQELSDKFWTVLKHSDETGLRWLGQPKLNRSTQLV